jgi:hypothetical protein
MMDAKRRGMKDRRKPSGKIRVRPVWQEKLDEDALARIYVALVIHKASSEDGEKDDATSAKGGQS